ncbi:MAG: type II toxin-antitoxin system VapC family toxin [Pseudomonadota bacterium]
MIAVDTSALVAILEAEPDADRYINALEETATAVISAVGFVELGAVMTRRRGADVVDSIDALIEAVGLEIAPVTVSQAKLAREAYTRFSALNFGDSFAYALARERAVPLLFKGDDFMKTDLEIVM